jgi:hypothetical protein
MPSSLPMFYHSSNISLPEEIQGTAWELSELAILGLFMLSDQLVNGMIQ